MILVFFMLFFRRLSGDQLGWNDFTQVSQQLKDTGDRIDPMGLSRANGHDHESWDATKLRMTHVLNK